jgi:hypothetical protein
MRVKCTCLFAGLISLCVSPVWATPVEFTFAPDTTVLDSLGNTEEVSGSFYFDNSTVTITDPNITLTGPGPEGGLYAGSYVEADADCPFPGDLTVALGSGIYDYVVLAFNVSDLDAGTAELHIPQGAVFTSYCGAGATICGGTDYPEGEYVTGYGDLYGHVTGEAVEAGHVTGDAVEAPEPATLTVLGTYLAVLGIARKRRGAGRRRATWLRCFRLER